MEEMGLTLWGRWQGITRGLPNQINQTVKENFMCMHV